MKVKILSKLTIAQLACLPLISISCGKHEQKAKENLVTIASDPKFDKLIDKNKEEKRDKTTPIVEKIEVVNNGESGSKQIEKTKKVEIRNSNNSNLPINVEVKNDIKIDNKINTKESKLKTFFAVIGGLAAAAAVGYGLWWLFRGEKYYEITGETKTNEVKSIHSGSVAEVEVTIKFKCTGNCNSFNDTLKTKTGFTITMTKNTINLTNNNSSNSERTISIKGIEGVIFDVINKFSEKALTFSLKNTTNFQRIIDYLKSKFNTKK